SLEGGYDGYFSRRSSKFRSNMRRARKKADEEGVESVYLAPDGDEVDEVFDRILAIEQHSWKAENNSGIATGPMRKFYGQMVPMLAEDDKLRVAFVQTDDTDIAYCFGGLFEDLYRGLQLSYHDDYKDYSAGNLAQLAMLEGLGEEGIETYDMGQAMDYKSRWADEERESIALIVRK
ncbi:MAG: GNAT family N-acetyltransferase, partial [Bradymonadaceae bacterium]